MKVTFSDSAILLKVCFEEFDSVETSDSAPLCSYVSRFPSASQTVAPSAVPLALQPPHSLTLFVRLRWPPSAQLHTLTDFSHFILPEKIHSFRTTNVLSS